MFNELLVSAELKNPIIGVKNAVQSNPGWEKNSGKEDCRYAVYRN
jgi:hypothetical protein